MQDPLVFHDAETYLTAALCAQDAQEVAHMEAGGEMERDSRQDCIMMSCHGSGTLLGSQAA